MHKYTFIGKDLDEIYQKAEDNLHVLKDALLFTDPKEKKTLFGKKYEYTVLIKNEVGEYLVDYIKQLIQFMGMTCEIKFSYKEMLEIEIISSNDPLLIGKHGKNLQALNIVTNQYLYRLTNQFIDVSLDVNAYYKKRKIELEKLVHQIVNEVQESKIDAKLTSMNAYERKIIHHLIENIPNVYTESVGIEPNRYIIVKYKSS